MDIAVCDDSFYFFSFLVSLFVSLSFFLSFFLFFFFSSLSVSMLVALCLFLSPGLILLCVFLSVRQSVFFLLSFCFLSFLIAQVFIQIVYRQLITEGFALVDDRRN